MTDSNEGIDIAEKIVGPASAHPSAYDEAKEVWAGLFESKTKTTNDYITVITVQIRALEKYNVPIEERSDLIVASFWAASAEAALNQRAGAARESEQEIRRALENVWAQLGDD